MQRELKNILFRFTVVNALILTLIAALSVPQSADSATNGTKVCVNSKTKAVFLKSTCAKGETSKYLSSSASTTEAQATALVGKSAYEIWLELGNSGTKTDFINSLKAQPAAQSALDKLWDLSGCQGRMQIIELLVNFTYQYSTPNDGSDPVLLPLTLDQVDRTALSIAGCPTSWLQEGLGFNNGGPVTVPR